MVIGKQGEQAVVVNALPVGRALVCCPATDMPNFDIGRERVVVAQVDIVFHRCRQFVGGLVGSVCHRLERPLGIYAVVCVVAMRICSLHA